MRATHPSALARATPRPTDGDGDGPRGHGRTPVECRAHCASSKGRQRHVARVEPVGRGGTNGGGVARKLLRRGSSRGVKSGSRSYHNSTLIVLVLVSFLLDKPRTKVFPLKVSLHVCRRDGHERTLLFFVPLT